MYVSRGIYRRQTYIPQQTAQRLTTKAAALVSSRIIILNASVSAALSTSGEFLTIRVPFVESSNAVFTFTARVNVFSRANFTLVFAFTADLRTSSQPTRIIPFTENPETTTTWADLLREAKLDRLTDDDVLVGANTWLGR